MKNILLVSLILVGCSGCASAGLNGLCLNIQGTGISSPYTGSGKLNANGIMCNLGGISSKGVPPTYEELKDVMTAFINNQSSKITTSGPGVITFTPATKG